MEIIKLNLCLYVYFVQVLMKKLPGYRLLEIIQHREWIGSSLPPIPSYQRQNMYGPWLQAVCQCFNKTLAQTLTDQSLQLVATLQVVAPDKGHVSGKLWLGGHCYEVPMFVIH